MDAIDWLILVVVWLASAAAFVACLFVAPVTLGPVWDAWRERSRARRKEARTEATIRAFEECGVVVIRAPYPMERITRLDPATPPAAVVPAPRRPINGAPQ